MRILVVSDTHGRHTKFEKALEAAGKIDCIFHLGDILGEEEYFDLASPCPIHMVAGNNDFFSDLPMEKVVSVAGKNIYMTHGHLLQVHRGVGMLVEEAEKHGAHIAMHGHTHMPFVEWVNDILVLNPGSLTLPRQSGRKYTYIILEISESGEIAAEVYSV